MQRKQHTFRPTKEVDTVLMKMAAATEKSINDLLCEAVLYFEERPAHRIHETVAAASEVIQQRNEDLLDGIRKIIKEEWSEVLQIDVKKNHKR